MTDITLLDGGMGQELVKRSGEQPTPLWATQVMMDHPGLVTAIHNDYFDAGATIATTNSYALHHDRLVGTDLDGKRDDLVAAALDEARQAARPGTRIAGSVGPLAATYRPDVHPPHDVAFPLYAELAGALAGDVDLILIETAASHVHAASALEGARQTGKPVWLSITVDDEDGSRLRSGEPISDLADLAPDAWLANCSAPEAMDAALGALAAFGRPFGAYANGFTQITSEFLQAKPTVDALQTRRDFTPERYAASVMGWVEAGATIVGGCCEVGPAHIRTIAERLRAAGHTIV